MKYKYYIIPVAIYSLILIIYKKYKVSSFPQKDLYEEYFQIISFELVIKMQSLLTKFASMVSQDQKPKPIQMNKTIAFNIQKIDYPFLVGDNEEIEEELFLCQECLVILSNNNICEDCSHSKELTKEGLNLDEKIDRNLLKMQALRRFLISKQDKEEELNSQVIYICDNVIVDPYSLPITEKNLSKLKEMLYSSNIVKDLAIYYQQLGKMLEENRELLKLSVKERLKESTKNLKQRINEFKDAKQSIPQLNLNLDKIRNIKKDLASNLSDKNSFYGDYNLEDTDTITTISEYFSDFLNILLKSGHRLPEDHMGMSVSIDEVIKNWRGMSLQDRKQYVLMQLNNSNIWKDKLRSANTKGQNKDKNVPEF